MCLRVICFLENVHCFACHSACNVSDLHEVHCVIKCVQTYCCEHLSTVVKCKTFLGSEFNRCKTFCIESNLSVYDLSLVFYLTHSDKSEGDAAKRCKVSGSSY